MGGPPHTAGRKRQTDSPCAQAAGRQVLADLPDLVGLGDERRVAQHGGHFAQKLARHEDERHPPAAQVSGHRENLAVRHVDVEEGEVDRLAGAAARFGQGRCRADVGVDGVPHDAFEVQRHEWIVLDYQNPHCQILVTPAIAAAHHDLVVCANAPKGRLFHVLGRSWRASHPARQLAPVRALARRPPARARRFPAARRRRRPPARAGSRPASASPRHGTSAQISSASRPESAPALRLARSTAAAASSITANDWTARGGRAGAPGGLRASRRAPAPA